MKILCRWLIVPWMLACSATLYADQDTNQKLDAILKEITQLNERVRRLEIKVGRLTAELRAAEAKQRTGAAAPVTDGISNPLRPIKKSFDVESTIRLQQEAPSELLKNVHERERELRKRPFPADQVPH